MTKFIVEIDIANADDGTYKKLNGYLDHGTFQDGLGDAGVEVRHIVVRTDNNKPVLPEETEQVYRVLAMIPVQMTLDAKSPEQALAFAMGGDQGAWDLIDHDNYAPCAVADVFSVMLNNPELRRPHETELDEWAERCGDDVSAFAGRLVADFIEQHASSGSKQEAFAKVTVLITRMEEARATILQEPADEDDNEENL